MVKRFEVLDSFRGLSAIFVVICHMHYIGSITELSFFKGSGLFVEFFFVLSGFVLAHSYGWKENLKFKDFLIARTFRIMPLHIIMLLIVILMESFYFIVYKYGINFYRIPFTDSKLISDIIPNALLLHSWIPDFRNTWNVPSWSISIEYYMYMIFFVSLIVKPNIRYILWFLISLTMFIFIYLGNEIATNITRGLSCFFAGSLTYLLYRNIESKMNFNKNYFTTIETLLLILVILIVSSNIEHKSLIASLLFCIQIFIFAFEKGFISKILKHKILLHLGKLSYSIYMTHTIIISLSIFFYLFLQKMIGIKLVEIVGKTKFINIGNSYLSNLSIFIAIYFIILISNFTYRFIEIRGQKVGKTLKKRLSSVIT